MSDEQEDKLGKMLMKPVEYFTKAMANGVLLSASLMEFLPPFIQYTATIAGIVLTYFLIRKAYYDTELSKEQKRKLQIENDLKNQEVYRLAEENKRRFK